MPLHMFLGAAFRGWALAAQGQVEEGLAELQVLAMAEGWELAITMLSLLRSECHRAGGRFEEGTELAAEGLARTQKSGVRYFELQLHQVQGELLLMGDDSTAAEAKICFRQAIDIARRQGAKFLELRATHKSFS
jgi:hypothetical protein